MRAMFALFGLLAVASISWADDPHIHGLTVPDWYDPACCSQRDCTPVLDSNIEFLFDATGTAVARYIPTGNTFPKPQWRLSQDERYHVCISLHDDRSLCFYVRAGA